MSVLQSIKDVVKNTIGEVNILYLRKLIPSKTEKAEFERRKEFYGSFIDKGDLCFDVGANFGNRVSPFLAVGAKVVAIEPQDFCAAYLKKKFGNKIILIKKGLGEKVEALPIYQSNAHTVSSFNKEWVDVVKEGRFKDVPGIEWTKGDDIQMTTLDRLIEEYGTPAFIKIDVEGFEVQVVSGLNQPIKMISLEYNVPDMTAILLECMDKLGKIYQKQCECNYSVGEKSVWRLDHWLSYEEMMEHISSPEFVATSFGDIYIRMKDAN